MAAKGNAWKAFVGLRIWEENAESRSRRTGAGDFQSERYNSRLEFDIETNETALQSQQQILEENEERVKKIRQETEQAKEGWEKVQIDKDKAQDSYKYYKTLKNRCGI